MPLFSSEPDADDIVQGAPCVDKRARAAIPPDLSRSDKFGAPRSKSSFAPGRMPRQALRSALIEKAWLRYLVLAIVLAMGAFAIMTPDERAVVATKAVSFIGYGSPALAVGAVIGWATFSRKWWLWSTAALEVLTLAIAFQACWPDR